MAKRRIGKRPTWEQAEQFAKCRTYGHAWDDLPTTRRVSWGVATDIRCERCHTLRMDSVNPRTGEVYSRRYVYPDNYRDTESHSRSDYRAYYITTLADTLASWSSELEEPATTTTRKGRRAS